MYVPFIMSDAASNDSSNALHGLTPERLLQIVIEQAATIASLGAQAESLKAQVAAGQSLIEQLRAEVARLCDRLEEVERAAHRQAAPFRVPDAKRKADPKKPGRPPGHPGAFRVAPDQIDEIIDAPLLCCPRCGGPVHDVQEIEQVIEEIPPVRPRVVRLVTRQGLCARCGEVRSTHPLQTSTASGAAGVQLGPNALGVAMDLNRRHGLTMRKTCSVLRELFGLRLTPGGLAQAAARLAGRLGGAWERLQAQARAAQVIHADETGWWVGGPGWQLWVFANRDLTLYRQI